jgi:CheY-like chemotaxis protein
MTSEQARGYRILVVEDNVGSAQILARLIAMLGEHEVWTAHNGPSALEAAKAHQPDLILLDIGLPILDGYEVARRLRAQPDFSGTMLVAMTGYGSEEDQRRAQEAGFDEHMVKPPSADDLRRLLADPRLARR